MITFARDNTLLNLQNMKRKQLAGSFSVLLFTAVILCFIITNAKIYHVDKEDIIAVNGVSLKYHVLGSTADAPVILLHGNGGTHKHLATLAQQLDSAGYLVYSIDSRGQGDNEPLQEYHYKDMAEDVYCFAKALKLTKPAVFGWSDGGIVALQTEILHPNTFSLIVASGANVTTDGINDFDAFAAQFQQYDSLGNLIEPEPLVKMMLTEPNISAQELHTIQCPTLIVAGQLDLVALEHTQYIASCIPNSTTLILEGETHGSHILNNPKMGNIMLDYMRQYEY